jgi:methylated-DNA-[protein]-cysteine S-methyltransferase
MTALHRHFVFETAGGFCGIGWNDAGIARFQLPAKNAAAAERMIVRRMARTEPGEPPGAVGEAVAAARRYFEGEETDFSQVTIDLEGQDQFCKRVYAAARRIPWGTTTTYGALAETVGCGREGARDIGQAMARNPIPLIIPCHRVLAAGGRIGGFSAPGGAATKVRMLELEGVRLAPSKDGQGSFRF